MVQSITSMQADLGRVGFTLVVIGLLAVALAVIGWVHRRGSQRAATTVSAVGFAVVVVGVLSLTLFGPQPPSVAEPQLFLDPLEGARGWTAIAWNPVLDNVALFVPVGAMAAALWWRRSVVAVWLVCLAISVGIEAFQYLVPTGRVANTADVIANGVGAAVGILLAVALGARAAAVRAATRAEARGVGEVRRR